MQLPTLLTTLALTAGSAAAIQGQAPDGAVVPPTLPGWTQPRDNSVGGATDEQIAAAARPLFTPDGQHNRLLLDASGDELWVRGRSYKAHAAADGFSYIPFLGSDAPQNWPVQFDLAGATVGGTRLAIARDAVLHHEGARVDLDHGSVSAIYELGLEQVEQRFIVETHGLSGELVLDLELKTELRAQSHGEGIRFSGPNGGVDYSQAFVIDPFGARQPIRTRLAANSLELIVPAETVEALGGVVEIDPVFTTFGVVSFASDQFDVDVGYDRTADVFAFVYEDNFSAGDIDVYLTTVTSTGLNATEYTVDSSGATWLDPQVAGLNGDDVLLVVATRDIGNAEDEIVGRMFDVPTTSFPNPAFVIGDTGNVAWSNARPDVGGNASTAAGSQFLVCWERTFNSNGSTFPRYRTVDASGSQSALSTTLVPFEPGISCSSVRVSESTGDPASVNVWNLCFARVNTVTQDRELFTAQLNPDGSVANPASVVVAGNTEIRLADLDISDALDLDGVDPTYLISYDDLGEGDVTLVACRNASFLRSFNLTRLEHGEVNRDQGGTRLSTTAEDFVICYSDRVNGTWENTVTSVDLVELSRLAISERRLVLTPVNTDGAFDAPAMASRFAGGFSGSRYVGVGYAFENGASSGQDVAGTTYWASNAPSPAFQYCYGVPNSTGDRGFLRLEGTRSNVTLKTAVASALPGGQFCILVGATGFGDVPMAGGSTGTLCLGGTLGRYNSQIQATTVDGIATFTIDPTSIPSGTGTIAASVGQFYQWQVWHRDLISGVATSNFTNGVTIAFTN